MDRVRSLINCDDVHRRGYTGRGVGVAILDTGERVIILPQKPAMPQKPQTPQNAANIQKCFRQEQE